MIMIAIQTLYIIYLSLRLYYVLDAAASRRMCEDPNSTICVSWKKFRGLIYAAVLMPTVGTLPLLLVGLHALKNKSADTMGVLKIFFAIFAIVSAVAVYFEVSALLQIVLFVALSFLCLHVEQIFRELHFFEEGTDKKELID